MAAKRGLFLDFDGTLCDSMAVLRAIWRRFLTARGTAPGDEEFDLVNGPPLPAVVDRLKARYGLGEDVGRLVAEYRALLAESYPAAPPASGADSLLRTARSRGWGIAVVTSNRRQATEAWLRRTALAGYVDLVVGGDDVAAGKPDPEPYRLALRRLGAGPASSLAVEDGVEGARSALAAELPLLFLGPSAALPLAAAPLLRGCIDGLAAVERYL